MMMHREVKSGQKRLNVSFKRKEVVTNNTYFYSIQIYHINNNQSLVYVVFPLSLEWLSFHSSPRFGTISMVLVCRWREHLYETHSRDSFWVFNSKAVMIKLFIIYLTRVLYNCSHFSRSECSKSSMKMTPAPSPSRSSSQQHTASLVKLQIKRYGSCLKFMILMVRF